MATEDGTTVSDDLAGGTQPKASILLIVGEPFSEDHKTLILTEITKGFRGWDNEATEVDLNDELAQIANRAALGEEGSNGERLIRHRSDNLAVEVLVNPQVQTVKKSLRGVLTQLSPIKYVVFGGYAFHGLGTWILQDDTFSFHSFAQVFKDPEVENAIKRVENVSLTLNTVGSADWSSALKGSELSRLLKVTVNPPEKLHNIHGILQFSAYISNFLKPIPVTSILQPSDVVGNISFSRPVIYIFPACQGDSALFGMKGFNMLVNGGFSRRSCFWDFTRHLDGIDALLLTHLSPDNLFGVKTILERKSVEPIHPEIGYIYMNHGKHPTVGSSESKEDKPDEQSLLINLVEEGNKILDLGKNLGHIPHPLTRSPSGNVEPINLFHKVGWGSLDMYILNPVADSKEMKDFIHHWSKQAPNFGAANGIPVTNNTSVCALIIVRPANPSEKVTRILFPGNAPQHLIMQGLERFKNLEFMKHPTYCDRDLHKPKKTPVVGNGRAGSVTRKPPVSTTAITKTPSSTTKAEPPKRLEAKSSPLPKPSGTPTSSAKTVKQKKEDNNKRASSAKEKVKLDEKEKEDKSKSSKSSTSSSPSKASVKTASPVKTPSSPAKTPVSLTPEDAPQLVATPEPAVADEAPYQESNHIQEDLGQGDGSFKQEPDESPEGLPESAHYGSDVDAYGQQVHDNSRQKLEELGIYDDDEEEGGFEVGRENGNLYEGAGDADEEPQPLPEPVAVIESPCSTEPDLIQDTVSSLEQKVIEFNQKEHAQIQQEEYEDQEALLKQEQEEEFRKREQELRKQELEEQLRKQEQEEVQRQQEEEKLRKQQEEEELRKQEQEELHRQQEEEELQNLKCEELRKQEQQEELRRQQEEEELQRRQEEEELRRQQKEEELQRLQEEEELQRRQEEEELQRQQEEEELQRQQEEEEVRQQEQLEQLRREQEKGQNLEREKLLRQVQQEELRKQQEEEELHEQEQQEGLEEGFQEEEQEELPEDQQEEQGEQQPVEEELTREREYPEQSSVHETSHFLHSELKPQLSESEEDSEQETKEFEQEPSAEESQNEPAFNQFNQSDLQTEEEVKQDYSEPEAEDPAEDIPSSPEPTEEEHSDFVYPDDLKEQIPTLQEPTFTDDSEVLSSNEVIEQNIQYGITDNSAFQMGGIREEEEEETAIAEDEPESHHEAKQGIDKFCMEELGIYEDEGEESPDEKGGNGDDIEKEDFVYEKDVDLEDEEVRRGGPTETDDQCYDVQSEDHEDAEQDHIEVSNIPEAFEKDESPVPVDSSYSNEPQAQETDTCDVLGEDTYPDTAEADSGHEDTDSIDGGTPDSDKDVDELLDQQQPQTGLISSDNDVEEQMPSHGDTPVMDQSYNPFLGLDGQTSAMTDSYMQDEQPNPFEADVHDTISKEEQGHDEFDPLSQWGHPTGLPSPIHPQEEAENKKPFLLEKDASDTEEVDSKEFDPLTEWGQPMGLPSPPPPESDAKPNTNGVKSAASDTKKADPKKSSPTKPKSAEKRPAPSTKPSAAKSNGSAEPKPARPITEKKAEPKKQTANLDTTRSARPSTAPSRNLDTSKIESKPRTTTAPRRPATTTTNNRASPVTAKMPPLPPMTPFYVDLTYVPAHGDPAYCDIEFFKRVRARYYVLSALAPNPNTLQAVMDAKATWEGGSDLEVTIIPTYETEALRHWMALHKDQLAQLKIDVAPAASRCTVRLQDHEDSCFTYRLEF